MTVPEVRQKRKVLELFPPFHRDDFPKVQFWTRRDYKNWKKNPQAQGIDQDSFPFLEDEFGVLLPDGTDTDVLSRMRDIWQDYLKDGIAPSTWGGASASMKEEFCMEIVKNWPELGLCANNWKIHLMATARYPSWAQHCVKKDLPVKRVKSEPEEVPSDLELEGPSDAKRIKTSDFEIANEHHYAPLSPLSDLDTPDSLIINPTIPIALKPTNNTMSATNESSNNSQSTSGMSGLGLGSTQLPAPAMPVLKNPLYHSLYQ
ncbi:hypothetical protein JVU11DRAFT_10849 [Chiua virens]|nr:hypothetical protein JVU11DRAFT_10849 [Chiua virens]